MAKREHDREDLLAEATALVERIRLRVMGCDDIVIGFRRDHGASFYLGADRVYQFTSAGQLRRAFVGELLYKAERGQLVSLRRQRTATAVELVRQVLNRSVMLEFMQEMRTHLEALHDSLAKGRFEVVGQVPDDADLVSRVRCWLDEFAGRVEIARAPRAQ